MAAVHSITNDKTAGPKVSELKAFLTSLPDDATVQINEPRAQRGGQEGQGNGWRITVLS